MTITTSLAKAFSFTFNPPSKTAVLPCNGNLSNQQIGSIVSNEWRFYAPANFMTLAVEQETARRGPTWRILGFVLANESQRLFNSVLWINEKPIASLAAYR